MPLEDRDLRSTESVTAPPPGAIESALAGIQALPEDTLILIPTRNLVLFPGTVLPITLGRQRTIAAATDIRWTLIEAVQVAAQAIGSVIPAAILRPKRST